ncbi:MAG TPA: NAD(P)H-dependent glycerol-3-phosphate dehydrogenase [Ktedonobacterales bacterium]|nr:NAD(P)H-dependent glycerol-3-phosphate dehydrogenase [Ktedonobacterales bacterium]
MSRVAVIGTGAWGTTLARLVAQGPQTTSIPDADVTLWEHRPERAAELERERENRAFLPGFHLPPRLRVCADLAEAVTGREMILLVTPAQRMREQARLLAPLLAPGAIVVSCSKGLELGSHQRMSQILAETLPAGARIGALSGPNLAREVAQGLPTGSVVASADASAADRVRLALSTPTFRVYTSVDLVGVELGGALKNIIALGVGVNDGLGYGDNAKATFMTRGLAEMSRLAMAAGANPLTLAGLAGLGDLIATCSSPLSRNRTLGLELAAGKPLAQALAERKTVTEGVTTTRAALELAANVGVELPITEQIARVLFEGKPVREAVSSLMERDPKHELHGLSQW